MDAYEQSLGYRSSDTTALLPVSQQNREHLSEETLLQMAKDTFDANLAEALRVGFWHWKLDILDIAAQIAEDFSFKDDERYARLRTTLLQHYNDHYRRPTKLEWWRREEAAQSMRHLAGGTPVETNPAYQKGIAIAHKVDPRQYSRLLPLQELAQRNGYQPDEWGRPSRAQILFILGVCDSFREIAAKHLETGSAETQTEE